MNEECRQNFIIIVAIIVVAAVVFIINVKTMHCPIEREKVKMSSVLAHAHALNHAKNLNVIEQKIVRLKGDEWKIELCIRLHII